jgi:hypothetical protein
MAAINTVGAVFMWGGIFTAMYLYYRLRKEYGSALPIQRQVATLLLLYLNNFVAAEGGALMMAGSVTELEWHRTLIAFGISNWLDLIMTGFVMFQPDKKETKETNASKDS